jgi:hypothetical protein
MEAAKAQNWAVEPQEKNSINYSFLPFLLLLAFEELAVDENVYVINILPIRHSKWQHGTEL